MHIFSNAALNNSMKITGGWLDTAKKIPSPNCDLRPAQADLSLIVIHCISLPPGQFGGDSIDLFFTNRLDPQQHPYFESIHRLKVSAHILIRRTGEIVQYVPFHMRAWHAGPSCYGEHTHCNDFSIGIELEGLEDIPYREEQYEKLAELIQALIRHYPTLSCERLAGHSDIAPGRKTDPGASFDWAKLKRLLAF